MFAKQHNSTIKLSGFTLIEILVTIGILIIMSALAVFSFTNSNPDRQLNLTAENIIGQLQQAQSLSFTGAKQGIATPNGYGVFIDFSDQKYKLYADTNSNNIYDSDLEEKIGNDYDLPIQLTLSTIDNTNTVLNNDIDIFFSIPNAYLNITAGTMVSQSVDVILAITAGQSKTIKINTASNSFWIE